MGVIMGGSMRSIAVLGSLNADVVIQMDRYPNPGETVVAKSFAQFSGGKGANQAVACGRLNATVSMFGAVGKDIFAATLLHSLEESKVTYHDLCHCEDTSTGMAHIWVDANGENSIAIVAGANARVDKDYIEAVLPKLKEFSWLLLQLEVPMDSMSYLLDKLPSKTPNPKVILDPAPAQSLAQLPTRRLWLMTPNEHELQSLTGISTVDTVGIQKACRVLIEKTGTQAVLCKAGSRGAYLDDGNCFRHFPAYAVRMVDSTAAGDAFNGTLAVALSEGKSLPEAIGIANAAGALCVTRPGAQQSMPWRKDLDSFLNTRSPNEQELA
jgi:ribokinase